MSTPEALKRAQDKYNQKCKQVCLRFTPKEKFIYEAIQLEDNSSKYIKELIIRDLKKKGMSKEEILKFEKQLEEGDSDEKG